MSKFVDTVAWSDDETIDSTRLNQMVNNDKYLLDRVIPMSYQAYGLPKTTGLKIACGIASISAPGREIAKNIEFGTFFTTGSRPVVVASLAVPNKHRVFLTIKGTGMNGQRISHTGFTAVLSADPLDPKDTQYFTAPPHIHWIAIGY